MSVIPATAGSINRRITLQADPDQMRSYLKNAEKKTEEEGKEKKKENLCYQ
jgi:hypothetical protein